VVDGTASQGPGRREKHSRPWPGGRGFWWTERLWTSSAGLPIERIELDDIAELDRNCWFEGPPSIRDVAEHARRIADADPAHPVILAADGSLMDGGHRVARAWLAGDSDIAAVRFPVTPEPDWIEPQS